MLIAALFIPAVISAFMLELVLLVSDARFRVMFPAEIIDPELVREAFGAFMVMEVLPKIVADEAIEGLDKSLLPEPKRFVLLACDK